MRDGMEKGCAQGSAPASHRKQLCHDLARRVSVEITIIQIS